MWPSRRRGWKDDLARNRGRRLGYTGWGVEKKVRRGERGGEGSGGRGEGEGEGGRERRGGDMEGRSRSE